MPTERRTRLSVRPMRRRMSGGTLACVIDAGCPIKLSTPPSDSASAKTLVRSTNRRANAVLPTYAEHAAEPFHLTRRELVLRVRFQPRVVHAFDAGVLLEPFGDAPAVGVVLAHAEREGLGAPQRKPAVERPRHRA